MERKGVLTKVLAITGTVLVWIPILFTLLTAVIGTLSARMLRFDYLIPAELFPVVLAGALLLLWAALRARSQRRLIGWGLGAAVVFLAGSMALAVVTGLASGKVEPTGWAWAMVLTLIGLYWLALIDLCIAGILLVRKL